MDMSSLANVRSITSAPGAVTTYDERGNRVITNASLKNGNGTPSLAYSLAPNRNGTKNAYAQTISRWNSAKRSGSSTPDITSIRELMKNAGYDIDGLTDNQVMSLYGSEMRKNSFDMNYLNGRVTGKASTVGAYKQMTGRFGATKR